MIYVSIILTVAFVFVLTRLYFLKKEIKRTTVQLHERNHHDSGKKLTLSYYDKDLERLAQEVNKQIDATRKTKAEQRMTENELKQAISHISHDIRTPMTSILGYVQFLESDDLTPEMRKEYTTTVKNGAKRLKVLLEDFFELSVIEQADYPVKAEKIKLNQFVLDVLLGFYEAFNQKNIEPTIDIADTDRTIMADPSAVKRVIENLLTNAIRHANGQVAIQLRDEGDFVELTISNSVDQLSEQDVTHMFNRFYKADQTRTGNGTGLGLPIAKSLMEKMNGSLTAELKGNELFMKCKWNT
ncbi:Signal transduction histidine kinase [Oceanobacillus limi]|uniref:histidine kinase n=1 Tax=Oceanobacillus limi TaxID=930131 RepID=A0A1I0G2A3_9BACI|nr:HAMP domain-containing sensor histidine kinase [Oceanobacillus limi]SET64727.1 Signal transduction histidine kinase [Oceanobacillus limi]